MTRRVAFVLCAATALAVYANSIPNDFAYDDYAIILKNPRVHGLSRWAEVVTGSYWPWEGGKESGLYRPVTSLTFAFDWALWDGDARGFHLFNVLAHATATVLLLALLLRLFAAWAALGGALLFAVHPIHTEAVANVVGRAEILATGFALGSLLCLGRPRPGSDTAAVPSRCVTGLLSVARPAGAALLYALAILSKEGAIVLPGLLLAADAAQGALGAGVRAYLRSRRAAYAALFGAALAVLAARAAVLGAVASVPPADAFIPDASFQTRFFTMIRVWPHYVRLLVAPFDLSANYSPAVILPVGEITWAGSLGLVLAVAIWALAASAWRRDPRITGGLAWIMCALLPVSNLLFVTGVVLAERTLYLPSAGLSLLVAALWERLATIPRAKLAAVGYAALLAAFATRTVMRNPDWRNGAAIFNSVRRDRPESFVAHWVLASDLVRRGRLDDATRWYASAYRIWPHKYDLIVEFAGHLLRTGAPAEAASVAAYGTRLQPATPAAWQLLAVARYREAKFLEAAELGDRAPPEVQRSRWFAYTMAAALEALQEKDEAEQWWARVRSPAPSYEMWAPLYQIARLQLERGDTALARETLPVAYLAATGDSLGLALLRDLARELPR